MISPRSQCIELIEHGAIPATKIAAALRLVNVAPDGKSWRRFVEQLLLWLGGLALAFALMFFIAYNWSDLGRFAKFGLVEGIIILAIAAYYRFDDHSAASKVSLLVATLCLGVLLAFYGQTYQTGADPWQLFFTWALLMLPWALIGRFPALWIVWITLINTSIILYHQTFRGLFWFMSGSEIEMLWLLFFLNTAILALWELLAGARDWLSERWAIRLPATAGGIALTWLVLNTIFSGDGFLPIPAWLIWLVAMYAVYRRIKPDLFMLAGCCLSAITVIVSFLGKQLLQELSSAGFLFIALMVIGLGAGAAFWLKKIHQEHQL